MENNLFPVLEMLLLRSPMETMLFFQASPCSLPKSTSFYKEWMDLGLSVAFKTVAVNHYAQKHSAVSNDSFTYTTLQNKLQPKVS